MARYTFDTSDEQEAALTDHIAALNAGGGTQFLSNQAYLTQQFTQMLEGFLISSRDRYVQSLATLIRKADINAIKAAEQALRGR